MNIRCGIVLASMMVLPAYAVAQQFKSTFTFDMRKDDQHAVIIDYKYLSGTRVLAIGDVREIARNMTFSVHDETFDGPRATSLYVKWRNTDTNLVYEETANLEGRLPANMDGRIVTFLIIGDKLHLFVVLLAPRSVDTPPIGPWEFHDYQSIEIYPVSKR